MTLENYTTFCTKITYNGTINVSSDWKQSHSSFYSSENWLVMFLLSLFFNTNYNGHFMPLLRLYRQRNIYKETSKNTEKGRPKREQFKFFANCYRQKKNRAEFNMATEPAISPDLSLLDFLSSSFPSVKHRQKWHGELT